MTLTPAMLAVKALPGHSMRSERELREIVLAVLGACREPPELTLALFPEPIPCDFLEFTRLLWDRVIDARIAEETSQ